MARKRRAKAKSSNKSATNTANKAASPKLKTMGASEAGMKGF